MILSKRAPMLSDELAKICDQVVAELDELRTSANAPKASSDFWLHLFFDLREIKSSAGDYERAMRHYESMLASMTRIGPLISTESLEILGRAMDVWRRAKTREARRTR